MAYSDWQQKRIRDALRAYHQYGRGSDGERFNWKDVAEAIDEYAGERVPPERLRQFVEGINTGDGGRKYPVPKGARIEAIVRFVTHEDLNLLSEDELKEFMPQYQAPLRLLEYLDQAFDTERLLPPDNLQGAWQTRRNDDDGFSFVELTMQRPSEDGLIQVVETEDWYDADAFSQFDSWSSDKRKQERNSRIMHGGWAILTPEDNLLLFMKNESNGRNHYYLTLVSDSGLRSDDPVAQLMLYYHDYPFEPEVGPQDNQALIDQVLDEFRLNIRCFARTAASD